MEKVELLAPAGNFECLVAAIQNGADAVYFGANRFNARAYSNNFNDMELIEAINYAKLRNVKTHLTLNTLIKNDEFSDALALVNTAYSAGLDAIIVQDLGLAKKIIQNFPGLEIHSSTQATTYNLSGVKQLEQLGFNRIVLARELDLTEIKNICANSNIDIEIFIHGALCICYSGQCLMSSIIGGRSGNRGKCAGPCRLPYSLIDSNVTLDSGYLLSSKDVCTLDILPEILNSGVKSLKIEGRMKSPEYVGIVTSIYRKYIDLANSSDKYIVDSSDKEKLLQIFNRGGFSTGYLKGKLGKSMIFKEKSNHIGISLGKVLSYNSNRGYVKVNLENNVDLGDSIAINDSSCKISELMINNDNIKTAQIGQTVTIGRIKGEICINDTIYKTSSFLLNRDINNYCLKEHKKRALNCNITIKKDSPLFMEFEDAITGIKSTYTSMQNIETAQKTATSKERIIEQICKTGDTIFEIKKINIEMDINLFIPISVLNEGRRTVITTLQSKLIDNFKREPIKNINLDLINSSNSNTIINVSVLFNQLEQNIDYSSLYNIDNVYIPVNLFLDKNLTNCINKICNTFNTYLYLPCITKGAFEKLVISNLSSILANNLKGIIISNISQLEWFNEYRNLELIANYNLNICNDYSAIELENLGFNRITLSPEFNKDIINTIKSNAKKEVIVYGRTLLMTSEYCPIGSFQNCTGKCTEGKYVLKDRLNFEFPIYTNKLNCNSMIYNSKITSISSNDLNINSIRLDFLDEKFDNMQNIINIHKNQQRLEGNLYTSGNLNKEI